MNREYRLIDEKFLIEQYRNTNIALDRLPYTDEFERMFEKCPPGTMRRDLWLNLTRIRKSGKLPRILKNSHPYQRTF